jgi:hypothetical protein
MARWAEVAEAFASGNKRDVFEGMTRLCEDGGADLTTESVKAALQALRRDDMNLTSCDIFDVARFLKHCLERSGPYAVELAESCVPMLLQCIAGRLDGAAGINVDVRCSLLSARSEVMRVVWRCCGARQCQPGCVRRLR